MFDQSHRQAGNRSFLHLKPGCWAEFHLVHVHPTVTQQGKPEYGNRPYESAPMDLHVYRAQVFDRDIGGPSPVTEIDDVLRWEPQAQNIAGLINLADDAAAKHGDKTAITRYKIRVDVNQKYSKKTGFWFYTCEFRVLDANGVPLPERQFPPQPTVAVSAPAQPPPHQPPVQQYQQPAQQQPQPQPVQQQAPVQRPGLSPLDELRESLAFVQDFTQLKAAWDATAQRLAAAGLVTQAQQLVAPVKERLLREEVNAHTDHAMLQGAKPGILQRCGNDLPMRQRLEQQIDQKLQLLATSFGYGANVEDIPL